MYYTQKRKCVFLLSSNNSQHEILEFYYEGNLVERSYLAAVSFFAIIFKIYEIHFVSRLT